jgi:arsenite-transporting ATPase
VLHARYFGEEVVGPRMLDRLGAALLDGHRPDEVLHDRVGERLELGEDGASLRLELPFASKGEISLKKLGPELIVRVNDAKRTMILPPAMDGLEPAGASFDDGVLHVDFERAVAHG